MNAEQFHALLEALAHVAGMADNAELLAGRRLRIGETEAVLEHEPAFDPHLLQLRLLLGACEGARGERIKTALLQANYSVGYAGQCVFSLAPGSEKVVMTMRLALRQGLSAHELWQELSDVARHATDMWNDIAAAEAVVPGPRLF